MQLAFSERSSIVEDDKDNTWVDNAYSENGEERNVYINGLALMHNNGITELDMGEQLRANCVLNRKVIVLPTISSFGKKQIHK